MEGEDTRAASADEAGSTGGATIESDTSASGATAESDTEPCITALRCSPERTVFTEDGNDDGWIATDTTVDVER